MTRSAWIVSVIIMVAVVGGIVGTVEPKAIVDPFASLDDAAYVGDPMGATVELDLDDEGRARVTVTRGATDLMPPPRSAGADSPERLLHEIRKRMEPLQ